MTRRSFIQNTAAAGLALNFPEPVFGQNEKKYRLDRHWARHENTSFLVNDCHEMVQDGAGRILLLTNETRNNLLLFSQSGDILGSWGRDFPGAHGLSIAGEKSDQFLMITDTERHQFFKTTLDGKLIQTWDFPIESGVYSEKTAFTPTETVVLPNGEFYVADGYGSQFILHYDAAGRLKNTFGGRGPDDKHLDNAHGICLDSRGGLSPTLLVTDRTRSCFKRFSLGGLFLEKIELPGACVCRPVIRGDYLYAAVLRSPSLAEVGSGFVVILNKENRLISCIGGAEPAYENGKLQPLYQTIRLFEHPHDVCVDADENLYVAQWASGKVWPYRLRPV